MLCLYLDLSISFVLDVLVLVSAREPSPRGWAKPMKGLKAMFGLTTIYQSKMNFLVYKACLANTL